MRENGSMRRSAISRLNELASSQSLVSCVDVIASDAPKLRDKYCASGSKLREADGCVLLDEIQLDKAMKPTPAHTTCRGG
jgi:hypothetical protein